MRSSRDTLKYGGEDPHNTPYKCVVSLYVQP